MGEYRVLRNQGLLYTITELVIDGERIDTSSLGGLEIHAEYEGNTFGLIQDSEGLNAGQTLLETVLWSLAYQNPQFVNTDGTVKMVEFVQFLEQSNGIDPEVFFPQRVIDETTSGYPAVGKSVPLLVNLNLPVIITNAGIHTVEGIIPQNVFVINPWQMGDVQFYVGITDEGQLFFSVNKVNRTLQTSPMDLHQHDEVGSVVTQGFIAMSAVLGNITHEADSAREQITGPAFQALNPTRVVKVPEKFVVPDVSKFFFLDPILGAVGERIFDAVQT